MQGFGSMLKDYLEFYKISQTDFAERLGISTKHMNEILSGKTNISEELMLGISLITDIDVNLIFYVETKKRIYEYLNKKFNNESEINKYLNTFCLNEMSKKKWITLKDSSSYTQNAMDLLDYLGISNFDNVNNYLNRRILYKKKDDADINKIYLWIKRCDKMIKGKLIPSYTSSNLSSLLDELKIIRNKWFNEEELINLFNKYGIYLVIEDALSGTKIRGCSMIKDSNPCIYITRYFKEKASFYFTLYHEIGHIKRDYNKLKNKIIINDNDNNEKEIDNYALNLMIANDIWNEIKDNPSLGESLCIKNNIPLCFLYSRLAYEGIISYKSKEYNSHKENI